MHTRPSAVQRPRPEAVHPLSSAIKSIKSRHHHLALDEEGCTVPGRLDGVFFVVAQGLERQGTWGPSSWRPVTPEMRGAARGRWEGEARTGPPLLGLALG